ERLAQFGRARIALPFEELAIKRGARHGDQDVLEGEEAQRPRLLRPERERPNPAPLQEERRAVQIVERLRRLDAGARERARVEEERVRPMNVQGDGVRLAVVAHEIEHVLREDAAPSLVLEEE